GNQWGLFPSASAAWRISQESFAQNWSRLDLLKLRASFGKLGNQNIDVYAASDILGVSEIYVIGDNIVSTSLISSLANKKISWESTTQYNGGIDFGFLNMFSGSFDVYKKITEDALVRIEVPVTTGVEEGPYKNIAEIQNMGWDFNLNWHKAVARELMVNLNLNISGYKNEITNLESDTPYYFDYEKRTSSPKYVWMEGEAVNSFLGYESGGIVTQADIDGSLLPTQLVSVEPGDLWYKDQNGDDVINADDRIILGTPHPDFTYSVNLALEYKNFDFSILIQGVYGAETSTLDDFFRGDLSSPKNRPAFFLDRWTPENPDTYFPKLTLQSMKLPMSDHFIEDISYLRGKEITLGYTIPGKITRKIHINNLRAYVNLLNAFTITDYRGLDPERPDPSAGSVSQFVHPPVKSVSFGLQVKL
ncbi:MAG: TonB-dependent receptor, partial [Bacteroidales bacterium]|nr:TonB-dependent receptor [Bacteroidales bacterium]